MHGTAQRPRTRKAPAEVHGSCRWVCQPTAEHAGVLLINDACYIVQVLADGYRLTKHGADTPYDLPADLSSCDCPDATYPSDRPGGCEHRKGLAAALAALATF